MPLIIRKDRYLSKYATNDSPRIKVLRGRTINIHHGLTREATKRGDPCKVRHYLLSKTDSDAKDVWNVLNHPKANALSEREIVMLLKRFPYMETDNLQCAPSVLTVHIHDIRLE